MLVKNAEGFVGVCCVTFAVAYEASNSTGCLCGSLNFETKLRLWS